MPVAIIHAVRTWAFTIAVVSLAACCMWAKEVLPAGVKADRVVVVKSERTLTLMSRGRVLKIFKVALGGDPVGSKVQQGDHKTPEGNYILDHRNARSSFYRSIHISYPDAKDRARAVKLGVSPGGAIYVHGLPNGYSWVGRSHRLKDWTDGCIAVTDKEMDEIWSAVPEGTAIEIRP